MVKGVIFDMDGTMFDTYYGYMTGTGMAKGNALSL